MGNGNFKDSKDKNIVVKNFKNLIQFGGKNFIRIKSTSINENKSNRNELYYEIEREDFKLGAEIIKKFEKFNSFSKEDGDWETYLFLEVLK